MISRESFFIITIILLGIVELAIIAFLTLGLLKRKRGYLEAVGHLSIITIALIIITYMGTLSYTVDYIGGKEINTEIKSAHRVNEEDKDHKELYTVKFKDGSTEEIPNTLSSDKEESKVVYGCKVIKKTALGIKLYEMGDVLVIDKNDIVNAKSNTDSEDDKNTNLANKENSNDNGIKSVDSNEDTNAKRE